VANMDGKGISVYEMMQLVGRAGVATKSSDTAQGIADYIRRLGPEQLVEEFHRSVAILSERNMLTPAEKQKVADYARDWVQSQPLAESA
jgi:hypothetical protein